MLKAMKVLVDSNVLLATSFTEATPQSITQQQATENVEFLRTQAESWMAVFFNVFGTVGRDSRGMVGDVISSWVSISGEKVNHKALISHYPGQTLFIGL